MGILVWIFSLSFSHSMECHSHLQTLETLRQGQEMAIPVLESIADSTELLLVGESHLEAQKGQRFYELVFKKFFRQPDSSHCLFIELPPSYQPMIQQCLMGEPAGLEDGFCEDMIDAVGDVFFPVELAIKKYQTKNIFTIDHDAENHPDLDEITLFRERNLKMATEISSRLHQCRSSLFIGGAAHLTGAQSDVSSIPAILKTNGVTNFKSIQMVLTSGGHWGGQVPMADSRWQFEFTDQQCRIPRYGDFWAIRNGPDAPLLPPSFFEGSNETFGKWSDFDASFFVDGL